MTRFSASGHFEARLARISATGGLVPEVAASAALEGRVALLTQ